MGIPLGTDHGRLKGAPGFDEVSNAWVLTVLKSLKSDGGPLARAIRAQETNGLSYKSAHLAYCAGQILKEAATLLAMPRISYGERRKKADRIAELDIEVERIPLDGPDGPG